MVFKISIIWSRLLRQSVLCSDSPVFQWSFKTTRFTWGGNYGVWGSLHVISMYRTLIIELCQGKDSFSFYGAFKTTKLNTNPTHGI